VVRRGIRHRRPRRDLCQGRRDPRPGGSSRCPRPNYCPTCCTRRSTGPACLRASEIAGRSGKGEDGKANTREVKLARLFTISRLDQDGRPVMDRDSSTCAFSFDGKDAPCQPW
jgi:hypothetical protein